MLHHADSLPTFFNSCRGELACASSAFPSPSSFSFPSSSCAALQRSACGASQMTFKQTHLLAAAARPPLAQRQACGAT